MSSVPSEQGGTREFSSPHCQLLSCSGWGRGEINTLIDMKGHLSWVQRPVSLREDQQLGVPRAQGSDSLLLWARLA